MANKRKENIKRRNNETWKHKQVKHLLKEVKFVNECNKKNKNKSNF